MFLTLSVSTCPCPRVRHVFMILVVCRKQLQQVDREFSPCGTPTGLDARDQYDLQLGRLINALIN
jgi:hypothetical protein